MKQLIEVRQSRPARQGRKAGQPASLCLQACLCEALLAASQKGDVGEEHVKASRGPFRKGEQGGDYLAGAIGSILKGRASAVPWRSTGPLILCAP